MSEGSYDMELFWAIATVILVIVEFVTVDLIAVWLAGGALAAFLVSLFTGELWLQIVVFIVVSAILLIATRPIVRRISSEQKKVATNADSLIGKECIVKEEIDNLQNTGRVLADGLLWTARTSDGSRAQIGDVCVIESIVGVKLIVRHKPEV